jgi:hypothetical protein
MSPLRVLAVLLLIGAAIPAGLYLAPHAAQTVRSTPGLQPAAPAAPHAKPRQPRGARQHKPGRTRSRAQAEAAVKSPRERPEQTHRGPLHRDAGTLLRIAALELAGGLLFVALIGGTLVGRRIRRRRHRRYALYELHLSTHDEAKPQDLEDMVEAIANIVRALPGDRARFGQPYLALELICGPPAQPQPRGAELEWSINVRCQPAVVDAVDGAIGAAYPDVRVGRGHGQRPRLRAGALRRPGHVMRFRKERSFVYSLIAGDDALASPPLEQLALAQVALGAPSVVRLQLTPPPACFEELARRLYRRHENKLVRAERWGLPEGGLNSTLNRAEMRNAQRTQNRGLFWLEAVVAADTAAACKTVAAALQARRGENRLHRRWMIARQGLYRRRFPAALPPLLPSPRSLISAAEAAHLLELPSARMKGVPVRRLTVPRIPAPPEALRASDTRPVAAPTADAAPPAGGATEPARARG